MSSILQGGTALASQLGHRISVDIDLFVNCEYGSLNLSLIKDTLLEKFPHISNIGYLDERNLIYPLYVGDSVDSEVKLDLCYDEKPIFPIKRYGHIRMLSDKDIAAMKMLAITTGERRKDYWDIHTLLERYTLTEMIEWGLQRYPYNLEKTDIIEALCGV